MLFKVDRLNTKSYVLEFGVNSQGAQQSPMVIEGQSLLPSPALSVPSSARPSNQPREAAEVSMFQLEKEEVEEVGQCLSQAEDTDMSFLSETGCSARPSVLIRQRVAQLSLNSKAIKKQL